VDGQFGRPQYQLTLRAFSSVTNEARVALHKRTRRRRLFQAYLLFSSLLLLHHLALCCFKIEMFSRRIFDVSQGGHSDERTFTKATEKYTRGKRNEQASG
jgi:hypothetical protein